MYPFRTQVPKNLEFQKILYFHIFISFVKKEYDINFSLLIIVFPIEVCLTTNFVYNTSYIDLYLFSKMVATNKK